MTEVATNRENNSAEGNLNSLTSAPTTKEMGSNRFFGGLFKDKSWREIIWDSSITLNSTVIIPSVLLCAFAERIDIMAILGAEYLIHVAAWGYRDGKRRQTPHN